jgi:hypothetical protein
MGRFLKLVTSDDGIERRASGYYSTPSFIAQYLADRLVQINPAGETALDPCIGSGEMARPLIGKGIEMTGYDVLDFALPEEVHFHRADFLKAYETRMVQASRRLDLPYDFYVANPPYNCHEVQYIRDNKQRLGRIFCDVGCHNMYSMFISAMIDCAKQGATLGIVTLDSFLTSRVHEALRRKILDTCSLHDLILCPTDLFWGQGADVRTCVIVLRKGKSHQCKVRVLNRQVDSIALENSLGNELQQCQLDDVVLKGESDRVEFTVGVPGEIRSLFSLPRLSSRFRCVTGISTGNDKRFLSKAKKPGYSVPFYKNPGSRKFFTGPNCYLADDFLEQSRSESNFMVRNQDVLFRSGITCSSMGVPFSACYLPANSTFGVNANIILGEPDTWWMLSYLNSSLVTYLVRGVLIRTNMVTSGYVSRLPVPEFSKSVRNKLAATAREAFQARPSPEVAESYVTRCDRMIEKVLGFSAEVSEGLKQFKRNLIKAT